MEYVKECGQIKKQENYVFIDSIGHEKKSRINLRLLLNINANSAT